jgi:RNA polymerase sigma factor (sigma-70 family)
VPPSPEPRHAANDTELARRIAAGDEAAFAGFYEVWFAPALLLARAIGRRDEAWSLDVVQDVMMAVAKKMPALPSDASVRAWMIRAVANAVTDGLRAEVRRKRREQRVADTAPGLDGEPWLALVADERRAWLDGCLAAMPAIDRELLAARFGSATTVAAAAAEQGITEDAAHGRLRRALARLRRSAEEWWHG